MGRTLKLVEVDPDGNPAWGFGEAGVAKVHLPATVGLHLSPAALDAKGRILLAASSARRSPHRNRVSRGAPSRRRLYPDGKIDRSFGGNGWIFSRLPGRRELISSQATLDPKGRLLVGGIVAKPHHLDGAFVVARYLLGS